MAQTPSTMLPLGTPAPDFELPDPQGRVYTRDKVKSSQGLLVMFICNHCPFVRHVNQELVRLGRDYMQRGIGMVAINSNDYVKYPDDSPEKMDMVARELGYPFPYVIDETQQIAASYRAACTPDFFLFDANMKLVYRGQLDDSRPSNNKPIDGKDLRQAMDLMLAGKPISVSQSPSVGCNIKWKAGREPEYFIDVKLYGRRDAVACGGTENQGYGGNRHRRGENTNRFGGTMPKTGGSTADATASAVFFVKSRLSFPE